MICALLVFAGALPSAHQALRWYELMRGGKRSGVTIPGQIRWVAMFERWVRMQSRGLASDPFDAAPDHCLRSVRVGPFRDTSAQCVGRSRPISVRVGLFSRSDLEKKAGFWYGEHTCYSDMGGHVEVSLAGEPGPVWAQRDGVIAVVVKHGGVRTRMKVWWHHAYLQRTSRDELVLQVRKEWIEGLHHDAGTDKKAPMSFTLRAVFSEVADTQFVVSV
mmetsp:Transcript_103633/g.322999  ORF Transcript_103633/g.322999 Transcript_103633/m.322999 type:complete len:218 (-) Transcript_103633:166-819(-)